MYKNNFNESELPYAQFEALGLKKNDVLSLPSVDFQALLSGRRTDFIQFREVKLDGHETIPSLDAKISLARNEDGSVSVKIHPIHKEAPNIFHLKSDELAEIYSHPGQMIEKEVTKVNGEKEEMLIQYDPDTKEFVGKNIKDIISPQVINDVILTDWQKDDWKKGREVDIDGEKVSIDLSNPVGFIGKIVTVGFDGGLSLAISSLSRQSNTNQSEIPDRIEKEDNEVNNDYQQYRSRGR